MQYRVTHDVEDMHKIVDLEIGVWGLREIDVVPSTVLALSAHNGGVLLVAETDDDVMVGFSVSFPARRNGEWILWSHITGVLPEYQRQGIGRGLKLAQKRWAAEQGYTTIAWTFDPLQPGNANFNLNVLGAVGKYYHPNFYGEMNDSINRSSLPSDRLEAHWFVKDDITINRILSPDLFLVDVDKDQPVIKSIEACDSAAIRLPPDVEATDTHQWQRSIRGAFSEALKAGYIASSFEMDNKSSYYVLTRCG